MKKDQIYKVLYGITFLIGISFVIIIGWDYWKYDSNNNSAPFYVIVLKRIVEFIIPSIILFLIAKVLKKQAL